VQYQGSKRLLAPQILSYLPARFKRLIEPFAGMAAVTIASAQSNRTSRYHVNDVNEPVIELLRMSIEEPEELIRRYELVWHDQFTFEGGHIDHYYEIRSRFNEGECTAEHMLYLLARCVKGSVRYSREGHFNQSPDKRRHGTNPRNITRSVSEISMLLKGKVSFTALDYREVLSLAKPGDIVYMDPPYQGVTNAKDNRYFSGVDYQEFAQSIEGLNRKGIDYLISYDGERGGTSYGFDLPADLGCTKIMLNAGLSTQSTLLGKRDITFEALYLSPGLAHKTIKAHIAKNEVKQPALFEAVP
jgi:DNA adenine methylase